MLADKKPSLKKVLASFNPFSAMMYLETEDGKMPSGTPLIKVTSPDEKSFDVVVAAAQGVVHWVGTSHGYGTQTLLIAHEDGNGKRVCCTLYGHMEKYSKWKKFQ